METAQASRIPAHLAAAAAAAQPVLRLAAERTGVAFDALFQTARVESGFNPDARARTSSATGLFQFIDSTWLQTLAKHGARHGIVPASRSEALALRRDPAVASLMAGAHMADNAELLQARLGRATDTVDLYLAHFLGAGGAVRFLERLAEAPGADASTLLPKAAAANPSIFFDRGRPRTLQQVHSLLAERLSGGPSPGPAVGAEEAPGAAAGAAPGVPALADLLRVADAAEGSEALSAAQSGEGVLSAVLQGVNLAGYRSPGRPAPAQAARLAYLLLADLGG